MQLVIETSGSYVQVGLWEDGPVWGVSYYAPYGQSRLLALLIKQGLASASKLSSIAIHIGPGSHTGLRIGLAAAKALALARNLPLYAVPVYEAFRHQVQVEELFIAIDAKKDQIYGVLYQDAIILQGPTIKAKDAWDVPATAFWIGSAAGARGMYQEVPSWQAVAIAAEKQIPLSAEAVITLSPLYFRPFIPTQKRL